MGAGVKVEDTSLGNYRLQHYDAICWLGSENTDSRRAALVGKTSDFEPIGLWKYNLKNYQ
jgi:hypothetical protein